MNPTKNKDILNLIYLLFFSVALLVLDLLGGLGFVRKPIETLFQPITFYGLTVSKSINSNFDIFSNLSNSQKIIDGLKLKIAQLENKTRDYELLESKYTSLLSHSKVASKDYKYIQATTYQPNDGSDLILDVGTENGIKFGDAVVIGNAYIGKISRVDMNSSSVMESSQSGSSLEVDILINGGKKIKGIARGINHEIVIQNILSNSGVENGDTVIISDKSIPGSLILGKISEINQDSAASVITAKVSSEVDLNVNKIVYIRK